MQIIQGYFIRKNKQQCIACRAGLACRQCGAAARPYEEKQTDVNIACEMLKDAYDDKFDTAYLISGDSDLVAPVRHIKSMNKNVIIATPPKRGREDLTDSATSHMPVSAEILQKSRFPQTFRQGRKRIHIPHSWRDPGAV